MKGGDDAAVGGAASHGVEVADQAFPPDLDVEPSARHLHDAQQGCREMPQEIDHAVGLPPLFRRLLRIIPVEHERHRAECQAAGRQAFRQPARIAQVAHPGIDGLDAAESGLGDDFDHMVQPVRIARGRCPS